jgi:signal transduction histidine kinase
VRQAIAPALPLIDADQDRLTQAVVNLLSNAIKFSPAGGEVHVEASLVDGSVALRVTDAGRGIPDRDLDLVFEKFHQAGGANRQGTGLGLSITKALVEQHGGSIAVASVEGAGTTFTIRLPAPRG